MSVTYWVAKKIGVLLLVLYLAAVGVLIVSQYHAAGIASPEKMAAYYPPGRYARTAMNETVRKVFGLPEASENGNQHTVTIDAYTEEGAIIQLDNGEAETVPTDKVIHYLSSRDTSQLERWIAPLYGPLNSLMDIHMRVMQRIADRFGSDPTSLLSRLAPKIVVSVVYLGIVFLLLYIFKRVDRASEYKAGYSITYGAFVYWPILVIAISFTGASVVDMVRHLPDSYHFMHPYVVGAWATLFSAPLLVALLAVVDTIKAFSKGDINHGVGHAAVLFLGVVSIPLVTLGVLFAILVVVLWLGYRTTKRIVGTGKAVVK